MSLETAITFFIVIFIFGITPGPGVFAILAKGLVESASKCFMLALGMVFSDVIYLVLACLGLATLAENWSEIFIFIRYIGAAYLIYLGYKLFITLPQSKKVRENEEVSVSNGNYIANFSQGFLISACNPKVILFYISFLPTFIDVAVLNNKDILFAAFITGFALMVGLMLIALLANRMAQILTSPSAMIKLNQGAGCIMISAGTYLAVNR